MIISLTNCQVVLRPQISKDFLSFLNFMPSQTVPHKLGRGEHLINGGGGHYLLL